MQSEAVRLADAAARALDAPKADAAPEVARAAESSKALADRLADRLSPKAEAKALARAERGLKEAEIPSGVGQGRAARAGGARGWRGLQAASGTPSSLGSPRKPPRASRSLSGAGRRPHPTGHPSRPAPTRDGLVAAETEAATSLDKLADRLADAPPSADAPPRERKLP